ncbi:MAG: AmmeMemoRadiSam system protein B [Ignavibacteriales bacterium]|nr:MAG: AmmeMemoRadiSam system protein B [Ignavibacteriales bacterium]
MKYLEKQETSDFSGDNLVAGISPHDDFLYAGRVYFPLFRMINTKEVVIFGLTHGTVRKEIGDPKDILILDEFDYWKGPFGNISVSPLREKIKKELGKQYFVINNKAQSLEHSIEALLPFLQYYNRDIKITPIMVTASSLERMDEISSKLSEIISSYINENKLKLGKDIFFLFSSDANHFGKDFSNTPYGEDKAAHLKGTANDKRIADTYFNGSINKEKIEKFTNELWPDSLSNEPKPLWCGRYSIPFGLLTTTKVIKNVTGKDIEGKVLRYSDTWTEKVIPLQNTSLGITAPFSLKHWVGFLSAGFYLR